MSDQIYKTDSLISEDIDAYLKQHHRKDLLRFITCGSVDDGKSTLIGRLLYDSKMIFEDQLAQLQNDSGVGKENDELDFALLVDGLSAEREQGITIDVAYRFFSTEKRKFIVADTPGHEQYTRNMVTGASTADLAIILVDARKGILIQTRRHCYICKLLGIKHIILAINKMDLVNYEESVFQLIVKDFREFALSIGVDTFVAIPISGAKGDNILKKSEHTGWFHGSSLMSILESVDITEKLSTPKPFRMAVQWVNRPNSDFRGFCGKIISGVIKPNDKISIVPSGKTSSIQRIVTFDGDLESASEGQSVTLTLADEVDCSRGQVITAASQPLETSDQFEVTLIWMDENALVPGRAYLFKSPTQAASVTISAPKYQINLNTLEKIATKALDLNGIGVATITLDRLIPFTTYEENRQLGSFIIIDKVSNATVGAGLINFSLSRVQNIHWQQMDVSKEMHSALKNQKPMVLWLTGLSGSGKSTIANAVEKKLALMNKHTFLLDGDNVRHGLNKDLGFTDADRIENIRRIGEVSKLMTDAGLIVITAFISPFRAEREMVRNMLKENEFIEIFIDTPIEIAEKRDVKGLYAKARSGKLKNFTGIDSPYETPKNPELHIKTEELSIEEAADEIIKACIKK